MSSSLPPLVLLAAFLAAVLGDVFAAVLGDVFGSSTKEAHHETRDLADGCLQAPPVCERTRGNGGSISRRRGRGTSRRVGENVMAIFQQTGRADDVYV